MQSRRRRDRWSFATTCWVFKRQLALIVAITLLGAAAAAAYTFRRTPVYDSTASVLVRAITTNAFFSLPNKTGLSNLLTDGTPPDKRKGPVAGPG
jgi:uncharacterized protein involved in exopolysaccharide biosynthesis